MNQIIFVLRLMNTTVVMDGESVKTDIRFKVSCESHRRCFGRADKLMQDMCSGNSASVPRHFETLGWKEARPELFTLKLDLPLSAHEILTQSEGFLSKYWHREELQKAFECANANLP